jgi:endonuclease/exonuclease/phosphatase family metal-dependent hydrolase
MSRQVRVLSWNLYHGRDFPPDPELFTWRARLLRTPERSGTHVQVNRVLLDEFGQVLDGLEWDIALLQEAPPRWFRELCRRTHSHGALVRTSRNWCPSLQRRLADWNPDLLASFEGGSNQILVCAPGRILERRRLTLAYRPEQRRMLWTRLELAEGRVCVANLHTSGVFPERAALEVVRAAEHAVSWACDDPLVFGGDLNLRPGRTPEPFEVLRERLQLVAPTAPDAIDHLLVRGLEVVERPRRLGAERREVAGPEGLPIRLSDHAPVAAAFALVR